LRALALSTPGLEIAPSSPHASVAFAQDDNGKKQDKNDGKKNKNQGNDDDEDHFARGQVIGINTLAEPPEVTVAGLDGEMVVRVMKTDEISLNAVKLCDHVRLEGEKVNEYLFEATKIEVEERQKCSR
jgi:hypothetical protein